MRGRMNVSFEHQAALYAVSSRAYATAPMAVSQVAVETQDKVTRGSQARLGFMFFWGSFHATGADLGGLFSRNAAVFC